MPYKHPPITEAIFDIRIDKLGVPDLEKLAQVHNDLKEDYPKKAERINYVGSFELNPKEQKVREARADIIGYTFSKEDSSRQAQFRLDGFSYNVLPPYNVWEEHFEEFYRLWKIYNSRFQPHSIIRIATRFINRIFIPKIGEPINNYIINIPPIPKCLPQEYHKFFMQVQVPSRFDGKNVILTGATEPYENDKVPFILDIDVYQQVGKDFNVETLKENFDELRIIKNEVFESCITDASRKIFNL